MSKITLISYSAILVYYGFVVGQYERMFASDRANNELYKHIKRFRPFFFTGWNFACQIGFLVIALADDLSVLLGASRNTQKFINGIRSYFFQAIVLPSTSIVFSVFWLFYFYNREFIFPKKMDEFYPHWLNLTVHAVIILPVVIETLTPKQYNFVRFKSALKGLTLYLAGYQTLYFSVHFLHQVWIYPFYRHMTWPQRIFFVIAMYVTAIGYLSAGLYLQNLKKHPIKQENNKKAPKLH